MIKLLIFVLLMNNPDGTQTVKVETGPLMPKECAAMVAGVAAQQWPQVGVDEADGAPIWQYDATCADPKWAGLLGGGWRDLGNDPKLGDTATGKAEGEQR